MKSIVLEKHTMLCKIQEIRHSIKEYEKQIKKALGISLNESLCLCAINEGFTEPSVIAKKLDLSPSRLTRILSRMEEDKLIKRILGQEDRRNITITLTSAGKKMLKKIEASNIKFMLPKDAKDFIFIE